jgi:hypothetical protein
MKDHAIINNCAGVRHNSRTGHSSRILLSLPASLIKEASSMEIEIKEKTNRSRAKRAIEIIEKAENKAENTLNRKPKPNEKTKKKN